MKQLSNITITNEPQQQKGELSHT